MIEYDDPEYANSRLSETVVRINATNELLFINRVRGDLQAEGYRIRQPDSRYIAPLSDLNLMPLPLGYTNTYDGAFFLTRTPCRRYRQGSSWSNIKLLDCPFRASRSSYTLLEQPVYNDYPSVEEALAMVEDTLPSVAVSRNFALNGSGYILYRGKNSRFVGRVNLDNGTYSLYEDFNYLQDVAELELNG